MPEGSYTTSLFTKGVNKIAQKVGEEAVETAIAAAKKDKNEVIAELADLEYHMLVLMADMNITLDDLNNELKSRR